VLKKKMNTKILVALVIGIALFGLTGAASACETSVSSIYYEFVKTVDGQGLEDTINDLDHISSTAGWSYNNPDNTETTLSCQDEEVCIRNTLVDTTGTASEYDVDGIYHATVVQAGSAAITKRPIDSEGPIELEITMAKAQDVMVSGQFDTFGATFHDFGSAGVNYYDPIRDEVSGCGNCHATEVSDAWGTVTANAGKDGAEARISEAAVGTASHTSLLANGWTGVVLMDGGSSAYSEFFGDTVVENGASITTESGSTATHSWNANCGRRAVCRP
jgi:hypothetical protein